MNLAGWDTIGKTFVEGLTQSFFSLADVVTTKYGAKHGVNNSNRGPGEKDANTETVDRVSTTQLVTLGVCLQLLAGMVEGPEHTPDWDQILDGRQGGPGKVAYLEGQLRSVKNAIDDTPKPNIGTQEVERIVDEASKVHIWTVIRKFSLSILADTLRTEGGRQEAERTREHVRKCSLF